MINDLENGSSIKWKIKLKKYKKNEKTRFA